MGLPLVRRTTHDLLYSYQLSSAYRSSWVYDPSLALASDADVWEIVRNDAVILGAMVRRNQAIVRPWRVVPNRHASGTNQEKGALDAAKRLAGVCEEAFDNIDRFDVKRRRLAEAFFLGRTYGAIMWEKRRASLDATPEAEWWLPYDVRDIDRRRVHWEPEWAFDKATGAQKKVGIRLAMYDTNSYQWVRVTPEQRRSLIEYIYSDTEDRVGYGRGTLEAIYFYHYWKSGTFKKIAEGIDRYANGILVGRLDSLRGASTDKTNTDMVNAMKKLLQNFRSEHVVVMGDGDNIEVIEPTGRGIQISMEFVRYLDDSMERLINGSVRPSGGSAGGTGARAQAQVEENTSEAFYQDDRDDLDAIIDRDLLGAFLYHNAANIERLGLGEAKRPKFTSEQKKRQDPLQEVQVAQALVGMGFPVAVAELADKTNYHAAGPDEEMVSPPLPPAMPGEEREPSGGRGDDDRPPRP